MKTTNILLDPLPTTLCVDGRDYFINYDFRYGIIFEQLILRDDIEPQDKIALAINLFFTDEKPANIKEAIDQILWFYSCGEYENTDENKQQNSEKHSDDKDAGNESDQQNRQKRNRVYDYDIDAGRIYAAFLDQYRIDLTEQELHWWKFKALFGALKEDNEICKIIEYRSVDLSKIKNKAERSRLARLKAKYALPCTLTEEQKIAMAGNAFAGR